MPARLAVPSLTKQAHRLPAELAPAQQVPLQHVTMSDRLICSGIPPLRSRGPSLSFRSTRRPPTSLGNEASHRAWSTRSARGRALAPGNRANPDPRARRPAPRVGHRLAPQESSRRAWSARSAAAGRSHPAAGTPDRRARRPALPHMSATAPLGSESCQAWRFRSRSTLTAPTRWIAHRDARPRGEPHVRLGRVAASRRRRPTDPRALVHAATGCRPHALDESAAR